MELQVQKKRYECHNFGSCSKATGKEIIELLPSEKPVCPEDGYPLTPLDEERTAVRRTFDWLRQHPVAVAIGAVVVILVPASLVMYRLYGGQALVAPRDVPSQSVQRPGSSDPGFKYSDDTIKIRQAEVTDKIKRPGGDAAIDAARKAAAMNFVNAAVGFLQKGQLEQADEQLGKALAENPSDALAYINRAIIRARQKRNQEALDNLNEALKSGYTNLALLDSDSDFRVVRSLPGYRDVLAKNGRKP
jgi:tetratricopeptide (TPR) repeat protein